MGDETLVDVISVAAPFICAVVFAFHFFRWYFDRSFKDRRTTRMFKFGEKFKQLLKQTFNIGPSCETQEVGNFQGEGTDEKARICGSGYQGFTCSQQRLLLIIQVITYFILVCWFWRTPVTSISRHLVQPFGKLLSWGTGSLLRDYVTYGRYHTLASLVYEGQ